jgi:hypothetical protein
MLDPERLYMRLEDWWKCIPLWATGKEVVACAKDYRHGFHELPLAEFHLLPHYARLLGLLVDQKKSEDKVVAFAADLFARRFGAFLQERIRDLERVLGDIKYSRRLELGLDSFSSLLPQRAFFFFQNKKPSRI